MSLLTVLYTIFLKPLELFFEVVFVYANRMFGHPGLAIILLSLAMNILVLPLYRRADAMQEEERQTEAQLGKWVRHIKKTFHGDERFMMLQTYYRQNNYKPSYALKGSVSLLLEIPFFMAAYNFLSDLSLLQNVSFGPIANLGAPDAMLTLGALSINVLPILMTAINLVSSAIYTKGLPTKSKVQLYVMAGLFLVLLYQSPAGLVFYWTLNNLFSLVKNIVYKAKKPLLVVGYAGSLLGVAMAVFDLVIRPSGSLSRNIFILGLAVLCQLPLIWYFVKDRLKKKPETLVQPPKAAIFHISAAFLTVLVGMLIPSATIKASPEEFIDLLTFSSPLWYVLNTTLLAAGFFLVWGEIFYMLASPKGKRVMNCGIWIVAGAAVITYMFFGKGYGTLSENLIFETPIYVPMKEKVLNLLVLAAAAVIFWLIWRKKKDLVQLAALTACIAVFAMSMVNVFGIHRATADKLVQLREEREQIGDAYPITLSKTGKNVVVLMLDRAINSFVPYLMEERPELAEQFAGFTYYPNTLSHGGHTNFGTPGVFGGYEYTPAENNKRTEERLVDKQNEALKVMPVMFDQAGYRTTVCDPSYAGYQWIPDLTIYDDYPDIRTFNTAIPYYENPEEQAQEMRNYMNRSFMGYSIFKIAPVFVQSSLYNEGAYNGVRVEHIQTRMGMHRAEGIDYGFMKYYTVLENFCEMTKLEDLPQGTFMMMSNDATHNPTMLQEPAYEPAQYVDNTAYDLEREQRLQQAGQRNPMNNEETMIHYQVNMAAFLKIGAWLDYLRENDVFDNTKIIIVSDHGRALRQMADLTSLCGTGEDAMLYNPLLMVKDFDSQEFTTDNTFMTNADVPTLAAQDMIENPVNPFTGKKIDSTPKEVPQLVTTSHKWNVDDHHGYIFEPSNWLSVHDNIFDPANWSADLKQNTTDPLG